MKALARCVIAVAVSLTLAASAGAAQRWSIATSSTGSNPYILGSAISRVINAKQTKIELSAQTSGGFNANLGLVVDGSSTLGLCFLPDLNDAYMGVGKFAKLPNKAHFKDLRMLFPVYISTYHYVVRADSGIKSLKELKGKKFNLNVPSTATRYVNESLVKAAGMKLSDFKVFAISTGKSFSALQDGIVDATGNGLSVPASQVLQMAAQVPVHLLSVPDAVFEKLDADYHGTLIRKTIPANTYPGQTKAAKTFGIPAVLFVRKDAPENLIYEFTKAYWENVDELKKASAAFKSVSLEEAGATAKKVKVPLHPGVLRYLRERGVIQK